MRVVRAPAGARVNAIFIGGRVSLSIMGGYYFQGGCGGVVGVVVVFTLSFIDSRSRHGTARTSKEVVVVMRK